MHCYFGNHINIKKTQNTKKNYKSWKNYIYIYINGKFSKTSCKGSKYPKLKN